MNRRIASGVYLIGIFATAVSMAVAIDRGSTVAAYVGLAFAAITLVLLLADQRDRLHRRPAPAVRFGPNPARKLDVNRPALALLDKKAIVADALERLRDEARSEQTLSRLRVETRLLPITNEDIAEYDTALDGWGAEYLAWLDQVDEWRRLAARRIDVPLTIVNTGGSTAHRLEVLIVFPDGFVQAPAPEDDPLPEPPPPPKIARRRSGFGVHSDLQRTLGRIDLLSAIRVPVIPQLSAVLPNLDNVSQPRYSEGSLRVEFDADEARHGRTEEVPLLRLTPPDRGRFEVPWTLHADDLPKPTRGKLVLEVHDIVAHLEPITTTDGLMEEVRPDLEEDEADD